LCVCSQKRDAGIRECALDFLDDFGACRRPMVKRRLYSTAFDYWWSVVALNHLNAGDTDVGFFCQASDCPFQVCAKRFKWHALRHFAVSCWIEAGLQPKTVQTFVGHATLQMTMDTYGHMFPSDDFAKAMDAIAKGLFS
jgi:hypothetical protein